MLKDVLSSSRLPNQKKSALNVYVGRNVDVSNGVVFSTRTVRVKFINVKNSSGWISRWLGDFHRIVEAFSFQGVGDGRFVRRVCAFTFR